MTNGIERALIYLFFFLLSGPWYFVPLSTLLAFKRPLLFPYAGDLSHYSEESASRISGQNQRPESVAVISGQDLSEKSIHQKFESETR